MAEVVILKDQSDDAVYDRFAVGQHTAEDITYFAHVLNGALRSAGIQAPRVEAVVVEGDN